MKKIIFLLICCAMYLSSNGQLNWIKQWDHRFGGMDGDYLIAFKKTPDGGYILAGKTASDSTGNKFTHHFGGAFDYWIVKVNASGNYLWEKDFRGSDNDALWAIDVTADSGFIIGGTSDSPPGGDKTQMSRGGTDYWVLKLDKLGNVQWDQTFGGSDDEELRGVIQTSDGGYLIGGNSRSIVSGDKTAAKYGLDDYWVVKTDPSGVKQWDKVYGGTGNDQYEITIQTPDKGYLHGGRSPSPVSGNKTDVSNGGIDYWLVKTDSLGVMQWDSSYGGSGDENLHTITQLTNGDFICGGWSTSGISGDKTQALNGGYDFWILKVTSAGAIIWDRDFGGTANEDEFSTIIETQTGDYILGGTSYSNIGGDKTEANLGVEQPWILKINSAGNLLWDKTIFTMGHNEQALIIEDKKNSCYVVALSDNGLSGGDKSYDAWGGFSSDYWIVKYCEVPTTETMDLILNNELNVYPVPFTNELHIDLTNPNSTVLTATLYDIIGNRITTTQFVNTATLSTSDLSSGMYVLEVATGNSFVRKKIIR